MKKILYLILVGLLATASPVWGQLHSFSSGTGTETDPYLIASVTDWKSLAYNVNSGTSYSGKFFKQTADISITSGVGNEAHAFSGTFDGSGYTIDMSFENASILYVAPFRYINGATIRGVHRVGTLSSTSPYAGGIVGCAKGTSTIINCINSTNIINKYSGGDAYNGGIVSLVDTNGTINIINCLFNGTMSDEGNASNHINWSGIVGICNSNCNCAVNIRNCLFDPVNTTVTNGFTIYRSYGTNHYSNCYYTKSMKYILGTNGTNMTAAQLADGLGDGWHVVNGKAVPYVVPYTLDQIPDGWTVTVNGAPVTVTNGTAVIYAGSEVVFTPTNVNRVKNVTLTDVPVVPVSSIHLNKTDTTLIVGQTVTLTATVLPSNATDPTYTWSSDNTAVATVSNGVVTAMAEGTAHIRATANDGSGVYGECTVTMPNPLLTPLTMEALTDGTIKVSNPHYGMKYSLNGLAKQAVTTAPIYVNAGDKVQFYGDGTNIASYGSYSPTTTIAGGSAEVKVYGNIMSLVNENYFATATSLSASNTFHNLFSNNTQLRDAHGLQLPATTLTQYCYDGMFSGCSNMTTAPTLPATILANYCYNSMFNGCTSLTSAPTLPATTLVNHCYHSMFKGCTSLTSVTCLATYINASYCIYDWLKDITTTGTLYVDGTMTGATWNKPYNWTVVAKP